MLLSFNGGVLIACVTCCGWPAGDDVVAFAAAAAAAANVGVNAA